MAEIEFKKLTGVTLIQIKGRFTIENKTDFQVMLHQHADIQGNDIGVDATTMQFIDSSGIGELLKLKVEATKKNKTVYIFALNDYISRIFKASRLDAAFNLMSKEEFEAKFPQ